MAQDFISILDFETNNTLIVELPETHEHEPGGTENDDFVDGLGLNSSNSQYLVSGNFPLDLSKSSRNVLDSTFVKVKDDAIKRIKELFEKNCKKTVSFGEHRIIGNEDVCTLSYREDDKTFFWSEFNGQQIRLGDFCLDDLLFILEQIEESCGK